MSGIDGVNLGNLTNYLFVFTDASIDADWQGPSSGYVGDVAFDGLVAAERTAGTFDYTGTIYTSAPSLGPWQSIVNANAGHAFAAVNQTARLDGLQADLSNGFAQISALPVTPGFESVSAASLNGLNKQNGVSETFVINVTSGFTVSQDILITGDPDDLFILRWDTDPGAPGYQGQVKFENGSAIIPQGGLTPANFIHAAGDIASSGGGFFTGYWLTTGDSETGETAALDEAIFAGGWYTSTLKFSLSDNTTGVHVPPNPVAVMAGGQCSPADAVSVDAARAASSTACYEEVQAMALTLTKEISVTGPAGPFLPAPPAPGPSLVSPTNPVYQFVVTNATQFHATQVTLTDTTLGVSDLIGTMAPGETVTVGGVGGTFQLGEHCNTATVTGFILGQPVSDESTACFTGVAQPAPCLRVEKLISTHGLCGPFVAAHTPPGVTLVSPINPAFRFIVTNNCPVHVVSITLVDTVLGPITIPTTILGPGQSFTVTVCGAFAPGLHCNTVTVSGIAAGQPVSSSSTACFFGVTSPVPIFPDITGPAPQAQIIDRLLETVALEELALAALINSEAEKVQAVAAAGVAGPVDAAELTAINQSVAAVIAQAAAKEQRLLRKLAIILSHKERCISPCPPITG